MLIAILIISAIILVISLYLVYTSYILMKRVIVLEESYGNIHDLIEGIQEIEEEEVELLKDIVKIIADEDYKYESEVVN